MLFPSASSWFIEKEKKRKKATTIQTKHLIMLLSQNQFTDFLVSN
jgi:hypothetical protein